MPSVNSYEQAYVDHCRSQIKAQVDGYAKLVKAAWDTGGRDDEKLSSVVQEFEPLCFNHLVIALDDYFCHRARRKEGKDGNPLNEVRVIRNSLTSNDGVLVADKRIKLKPEESVLGYEAGERIEISAVDFTRLSEAFLAEIESRYL